MVEAERMVISMADKSLINQQVDEILDAEGFEGEDEFECLCAELYERMADEPEGMPDPESFGIGNIPVCDPCKAWKEELRAEIEG